MKRLKRNLLWIHDNLSEGVPVFRITDRRDWSCPLLHRDKLASNVNVKASHFLINSCQNETFKAFEYYRRKQQDNINIV